MITAQKSEMHHLYLKKTARERDRRRANVWVIPTQRGETTQPGPDQTPRSLRFLARIEFGMGNALARDMSYLSSSRRVRRPSDARVIALAEDDPPLRELIAAALELDGHRVLQLGTGSALIMAVNKILIQGGELDLLISDVRMPGLTGLDALKLLRDSQLRIPIILITAFSDLWTRTEATRYGARLLDKPLELGVLRKVVRDSFTGKDN
jgi:CheY-like chemotaxis protein